MADGPTENNEDQEKSLIPELQNVLNSKEFQDAANVYRVGEMAGWHSDNLLRHFPDTEKIKTGSVGKANFWDEKSQKEIVAPFLNLSREEKDMLIREVERKRNRDLIEDAWLYVCSQDDLGKVKLWSGHSIRGTSIPFPMTPSDVPDKNALRRLYLEGLEASFRGLFIRMGSSFLGTNIMLLDAGRSRWLYDWYSLHNAKDELMREVISDLSRTERPSGQWLNDKSKDPKLLICSYDYKIEDIVSLPQKPISK